MSVDPETLNALFEKGAKLLFLNAPKDLEFGIDCNSWKIGPRFRGLKLIPPGLHLMSYCASNGAGGVSQMKNGFFHSFKESEVYVREWDPETEDLKPLSAIDPDQLKRYKLNILEFEPSLAPYPILPEDNPSPYYKWLSLTNYITEETIKHHIRGDGSISSHMGEKKDSDKPGNLIFTNIDLKRSFPEGASSSIITQYGMDKSWLLQTLMVQSYKGDYHGILAELQLVFILFWIGQVFEAFQQWKIILQLLCSCCEIIDILDKTLFSDFIDVLISQLEECPRDFFIDQISENNFLQHLLNQFYLNVMESSSGYLMKKIENLFQFIKKRFNFDLKSDAISSLEEGEDAPVVVS